MNLSGTSARREAVSLRCPRYGAKGGDGGIELAEKVINTLEKKTSDFAPLYPDEMGISIRSRPLRRRSTAQAA